MSLQGPNFSSRPTLRINLSALKANYKAIQKRVGSNTHVAAAVKADAYGLGAERVSKALYGAGCRNFFVATAGEGMIIRSAIGDSSSIYVLNGPAPRDAALYFKSNLKPVINSLTQAHIWAEATENAKHVPYCAIHIDTGINRLGFPEDEILKLKKNRSLMDKIEFDLIMSHLACAPDASDPYNEEQLKKFRRLAAQFPIKPMSLANTAGIYLGKPYHFQMVRPGIGLYGGKSTLLPKAEKTEPVISLMAPVLQIRNLKPGDRLGYNSTYIAKTNRSVAIVGAGYADGIPISSSSQNGNYHGHATLQKKRVPIIGRVSMDLTALDISELKKRPRIGDWAEFLGDNLEEDSEAAQTLNYERLIRMGTRARREYK